MNVLLTMLLVASLWMTLILYFTNSFLYDILKELKSMSTQLSSNFIALQAQVQNTDGVIASAVTAFQGIEAELAAAIAANANGDTNALPNLQASLASATAALAAAVAAVPPPAGATPVITSPPVPASAQVGSAASFAVVATGQTPLAFQWSKNGTPIVGATLSTYSTPPVADTDNGATFSVMVSNSFGSAVSSPVALTVTDAPAAPVAPAAPSTSAPPAAPSSSAPAAA